MSALFILLIVCVTVFALFAVGVYRCTGQYSLQRRIEDLKSGGEVETVEEELRKPFTSRVILPIAETIARKGKTLMPKEALTSAHAQLVTAGLYPGMNEMHFLGICWLVAFLFLFLTLFIFSPILGFTGPLQVVLGVVGFVMGMLLPKAVLNSQIRKRQEEIMITFPYALDLLAICVEAGLGFDSALGYVMKKTEGALADEFAKTLNEIRLGKSRIDALVDLSHRIGVDDVRSFITAIIHVNRMGGSIVESLRVQADMVRVKRRHRAQERVMKAPIKMVFPLVLFIFPALFVVVLGPAVISIVRELLSK